MKRTLALCALIAVVAACGGDDSGSTTSAPSTTTTTSAATSTTAAATSTTAPAASTTTTAAATTTSAAPAAATCDHTYMPVRQGSRWVYETAAGDQVTWEVDTVSADGLTAAMSAEVVSGENGEDTIPIEVNISCGDFGMQAPELGIAGLPFGATVTQVVEEGVFLPAADEMVPGATWSSVVNITAEFADAPGIMVEIHREVEYTAVEDVEVDVPAGTFTALRVESHFTQEMSMGGTPIPAVTGDQVQYFAPGVGLVLEGGQYEDSQFDLQLIEVSVPG